MLMRGKPFREWVAVYYDPAKTGEEKLLKLLREGRCPRSRLDREEGEAFTVMNPVVQGRPLDDVTMLLRNGVAMSVDDGIAPAGVTQYMVQPPPPTGTLTPTQPRPSGP